ncbi:MAG: LtrC-like protein [Clostridia bacterium]|nr:LtrC-like protein [Clostridia bacterium]
MTKDFTAKKNNRQNNQREELSPQEWAEKKQLEKEALYQQIDSTAEEISENPDKLKGFLDLQARMDRYSSANALLIYSQLPEATRLKDFTGWGEDNVRVKKGAKSISILEPVEYTKQDGSTGISYKVKKMFDVSQTNGKKQPAPTLNRNPEEVVAVMIDTSPVEVEVIDEMPQPGMGAFYKNEDQTLYIQRGFGDAVKLCQNVAQELAFAQLSMENDSYNRREMGFKAVCVGYMVCKKLGIDTKSFAINRMPADWKDMDAKAVRSELSQMRSALGEIHSRVSDELYRQKQERSKDRER